MPDPRITVILATARGNYPMLDRPDTWIFEPTLVSLAKQTFRDFELVIVDALYGRRGKHALWMNAIDDGKRWDLGVDRVRWLPFPWSPWYRAGYIAIAAPKNEAIRHADGELIVQIDDCCEFDPEYLARCWKAYRRGVCLASMVEHRRGGKHTTSVDPRLHQMTTRRMMVDRSGGYLSFPREAALRINGFDEGFDGAKTLEDVDFTLRLQMVGQRIELDKRHVVIEHEHGDLSPDAFPVPPPSLRGDRSIKCNAVHDYLVRSREGEDRIVANRRRYTDQEWSAYGPPCGLYLGRGRCAASPYPCNWLRTPGEPDGGTWIGADPNWPHIRDWQLVVDLRKEWAERREREGK